jgi:hypothetical protein
MVGRAEWPLLAPFEVALFRMDFMKQLGILVAMRLRAVV